MKVVIASRNPVKIQAVKAAFSLQFPAADIEFKAADVASGVSDQPLTDQETRQGANNRAASALQLHPDATFSAGLEGGIESTDDQLIAFAWMAIHGKDGRRGEARTVSLPLPPAVSELVRQGMELGAANDRVFSTVNSKHKGGAFGLLTNGIYSREGVYTEALVMALVPLVNDLY